MSKRSVQQILDAVIDAGLYFGNALNTHSYMCHALEAAYTLNLITREEYDATQDAVHEYLGYGDAELGCVEALEGYLLRHFELEDWGHLPHGRSCWNFTKLYRNWAGRPIAEKRPEDE